MNELDDIDDTDLHMVDCYCPDCIDQVIADLHDAQIEESIRRVAAFRSILSSVA